MTVRNTGSPAATSRVDRPRWDDWAWPATPDPDETIRSNTDFDFYIDGWIQTTYRRDRRASSEGSRARSRVENAQAELAPGHLPRSSSTVTTASPGAAECRRPNPARRFDLFVNGPVTLERVERREHHRAGHVACGACGRRALLRQRQPRGVLEHGPDDRRAGQARPQRARRRTRRACTWRRTRVSVCNGFFGTSASAPARARGAAALILEEQPDLDPAELQSDARSG